MFHGRLNRGGDTLAHCIGGLNPVDHHFNIMNLVAVELHAKSDLFHFSVNPDF